jgi:hypothetical protein
MAANSPGYGPNDSKLTKETLREVVRDIVSRCKSHGKNFALLGGLFVALECNIESVRKV